MLWLINIFFNSCMWRCEGFRHKWWTWKFIHRRNRAPVWPPTLIVIVVFVMFVVVFCCSLHVWGRDWVHPVLWITRLCVAVMVWPTQMNVHYVQTDSESTLSSLNSLITAGLLVHFISNTVRSYLDKWRSDVVYNNPKVNCSTWRWVLSRTLGWVFHRPLMIIDYLPTGWTMLTFWLSRMDPVEENIRRMTSPHKALTAILNVVVSC